MYDLEAMIIDWATDRGIIAHATAFDQLSKTLEEVDELYEAIVSSNVSEVEDAIGDIIVTLIVQAYMWNTDITYCVQKAYEEIKDRRGGMVDGLFVKEDNNEDS